VTGPFDKPDLAYKRDREIQVFLRDENTLVPDEVPETDPIAEFDGIKELIERAGAIVEDLEKAGAAFGVPIEEDYNEVRASHQRLSGDGRFITFAEFRAAVDERSKGKADLFKSAPTGNPFVDSRRVDRARLKRHIAPDKVGDNLFAQLLSFGSQGFILWAINGLLGAWKAPDTAKAVAGKIPPATELPAIFQQIVSSMIMMRFVNGVSEAAAEAVVGADFVTAGIDIKRAVGEAYRAPPPDSKSYEVYRASLAKADHEIVLEHCLDYAAEHIGEGFEAWWAYLGAREIHEESLRDYENGAPYRAGEIKISDPVKETLQARVAGGHQTLDKIGGGLGRTLRPHETCCLLRSVATYDLDFLESLQAIIRLASSIYSQQIRESWSWYLQLANHPWNVISRQMMRGIDLIFDQMVDKISKGFGIGEPLEGILRECTPMEELIDTAVLMLEYLERQFKEITSTVIDDLNEQTVSLGAGWDVTWQLRRGKELLRAIDALIEEKKRAQEEEVNEEAIDSIVGNIQGFLYEHRIPGYEVVEDFTGYTKDAVQWCRDLADWDKLKAKVGEVL